MTMRYLGGSVVDVEVDGEIYKKSIVNVRKEVYGMAQRNPCPDDQFYVLLGTKSHNITLAIRLIQQRDLQLIGYQMEKSTIWLEFGSDTPSCSYQHLKTRSTLLGFSGCYSELERLSGGVSRETTDLGREKLKNSVNQLAISHDAQERAQSLIVVTQMIVEAIQFEDISKFLAANYTNPSPPDTHMLALERHRENAVKLAPPPPPVPAPAPVLPPKPIDYSKIGLPLVEFFGLYIDFHGEDSGNIRKIYGSIKVEGSPMPHYIYDRKRSDPEVIKPDESALLIRDHFITANSDFNVYVSLKEKDTGFPDNGLVDSSQFGWMYCSPYNVYDEVIYKEFDSKYGLVTLVYAVFKNAVWATVEVELINKSDEVAKVYGTLTAENTNFIDFESLLFRIRKDSGDYKVVSPGQSITLPSSKVAVPLDSFLAVGLDLYTHNRISSDDEIAFAQGTLPFRAQLSGTREKIFTGENGEIQVRVTWSKKPFQLSDLQKFHELYCKS